MGVLTDTLIIVANLVVNLWLLIILQSQGIRKQLPWFVSYIAWEVLAGSVSLALWLFDRPLFDELYWWTEAIEIALIVAAVRESFLRIFAGFTKIREFRWLVWSAIGAAVIYAAWKAVYAPPVQHNLFGVFEVEAEFVFRWVILVIAILSTIMGAVLLGRLDSREDAVVMGFGVASAGFLLYLGMLSVFGNTYIFFAKYLPPVGYFLAAGWWIWVFTRPEGEFGFKELGMGPDDIRRKLRQYRRHTEEISRQES